MKKAKIKTPKPIEKIQDVIAPKRKRNYRALAIQVYLICAIVGFTILAFIASRLPYFPVDLTITRGIQQFNPKWFDLLMRSITKIGYHPQMTILIGVAGLFLFLVGLWWEAIVGIIAWSSAGYLVNFLKSVVGRARPDMKLVNVVTHDAGKSFPSGHVLIYTVFFGYLWYLSYILLKRSPLRIFLLVVTGGLVLLVGPSRIYLGTHWFSDTMGAYLVGSILLLLIIYLHQWGKRRFFPKQPTAPETKKN